ncbi:MAG: hypothetical protein G01um1014107_267 [Parcubacteria group bacterium Gr01-1014_107]|nr:MAG: hypothetical protein G01um1014107_267 [Parcubacteria group bacterium Gr01-1014_107]
MKNGRSRSGKVIFESEGKTVEVVETDEEGRASYVYGFEKAGSWLIAVQLEGMPGTRRTKRVSIKEEKPKLKIPKKLLVTFLGPRGQQKLLISVTAEDGSLIAGFRGMVADGDEMKDFVADGDRVAIYPTSFGEAERSFEVRAGNTRDLIWRGLLLGPKTQRKEGDLWQYPHGCLH